MWTPEFHRLKELTAVEERFGKAAEAELSIPFPLFADTAETSESTRSPPLSERLRASRLATLERRPVVSGCRVGKSRPREISSQPASVNLPRD